VTTKSQGKDSGVTQLLFANKKEELKESEGRCIDISHSIDDVEQQRTSSMRSVEKKKGSFSSKLKGLFKKEDKSPFKTKLSQMNASNNYILNREVETGK
jgi:hypothetical protein